MSKYERINIMICGNKKKYDTFISCIRFLSFMTLVKDKEDVNNKTSNTFF